MGVLDGCHKIGRSNHPHGRLKDVGVNLPTKLQVVHSIHSGDTVWLEAVIHAAFHTARQCGEWFVLSADDLQTLASIQAASSFHDLPQSLLALYSQNVSWRTPNPNRVSNPHSIGKARVPVSARQKTEAVGDPVGRLPAKLLEARHAAGLSRPAAATAAAVGKGNLWQYETGAKTPTLAVLYKLAAAYGCNVCDLLPGGILPRAEAPEPVAPPVPAPRPRPMGKYK